MADRRIYNLTDAGALDGTEEIAVDKSGQPEATKTNTAALAAIVPTPALDDLSDVAAPAPNSGDVLEWTGLIWEAQPGAAGGVTDHGALTGLADDDHTQYLTDARHDAKPVSSHADVAPGGTEGQALVRRSGIWSPEALPSGVTDHSALNGLTVGDDHTQYHTAARADTWLGTKSTTNLAEGTSLYYTNARADARIAAANAEDLSNVAAGATEGEVLVSRTGVWTPEPLAGGGDMLTSTYDPAGIAQQVVGTTAAQTVSGKTLAIVQEDRTVDTASVTGTVQLDVSTANIFVRTMTGNTTFQFVNPPASRFVEFVLDVSGAFTITLPAAVVWEGGTAPTLTGGRDVLGFFTHDAGVTWIGLPVALGVS